jgi:hypothetical protein
MCVAHDELEVIHPSALAGVTERVSRVWAMAPRSKSRSRREELTHPLR